MNISENNNSPPSFMVPAAVPIPAASNQTSTIAVNPMTTATTTSTAISSIPNPGHSSSVSPPPQTAITVDSSNSLKNSVPSHHASMGMVSPTMQEPSTPVISPLSSPQTDSSVILGDLDDLDGGNSNRGHVQEIERIIEYAGPNSQYAKLNTILGRGAYKTVWKGLDREEGIEVAWNILETTKNEYSELVQETEILKKVRHPNVIHFYDSWYANGEFVFVTELMTSGTLREYIKKFKNPSMKIIKRWARQILKGLHYLHSQSPPIIHRDIKCDNIFINGSHGEVKIGDMGTAKMKFGKKYTVIGTPEFMAPEMYEEKGYSEKVDIYAFGMCLLEMVTGEYPYNECKNAAQIYKKVSQGIKPECLTKVEDKEVLSIILNCIAPENERWSARKLLEHPFFAEDPDVSLLSVDEGRTKLTFQVVFKGTDKQTVKFDFNTEKDTAENVVNEMIEEHILSAKFRQFVTASIHKILRDLSKNVTSEGVGNSGNSNSNGGVNEGSSSTVKNGNGVSNAPPVPPRVNTIQKGVVSEKPMNDLSSNLSSIHLSNQSQNHIPSQLQQQQQHLQQQQQIVYKDKIIQQPPGLASTTKKTFGPDTIINYDFEPLTRDYPNDFPIEDFVADVATSCNRDVDKANEWLYKLKNQDIMTVGDLRDLLDDDWAHLQLTVFASRALKNGLQNTRKQSTSMSPRIAQPPLTSSSSNPNSSSSNSNGNNPKIGPISPSTPISSDLENL